MITNYLEKKKKLIDRELDKYLPKKSAHPKAIHEAMRYSVLNGGKRIRPILVLECSRVCGGKVQNTLPVACAIELIHSYSLVHDDLPSMDDAFTRRGKPSCHVRYGEALATLTGDSLLTLAFNLIAKSENKARTGLLISEISKAIGTFGMIGGQVVDLTIKDKKKIDAKTMEYVNTHKTASLIAASCKAGAIAAGASDTKIKTLERYGRDIGLAFQIVDDMLDIDGYVRIFGMESARNKARRLIKEAKDSIGPFGRKADNLDKIADFILNRNK